MKYPLLLLTTFIIFFRVGAQNWQAVGPDDFKQISKAGAEAPEAYTDTFGQAYISYVDSSSTSYKRRVIKKETPTGWITIAEIAATGEYTLVMDQGGNFYFAKDTTIGSAIFIKVEKFDGTTWSSLGSPYTLPFFTSAYFTMKLDNNAVPYILYSEMGVSVFPEMIKWNGSSWITVGGPIVNTSYAGALLFDFDSNNSPYVLYYDALNNSRQIKTYDGTSWITVNTNVPNANDFEFHHDTMYIALGTSGYIGGLGSYSASCALLIFNGNSWVTVASTSGLSVPLLPLTPSTNILFDTLGNIYLSGGTIWKINGATITSFGAAGNMAWKGMDTFYAVDNPDVFRKKIRLLKKINSTWIEDYPLSIAPFTGGSSGLYGTYNYYPFHYFLADKDSILHLFGQGSFVKWENNHWTVSPVSVTTSAVTDYSLKTDTANDFYLLNSLLPSSSGNSDPYLWKLLGGYWQPVGGQINSTRLYGSFTFDKNNTPYVAFVDNSTFAANRVRVKKYDGVAWSDLSSIVPLISSNVSENPLIVCDTANNLLVLYKEGTDLILKKFDGTNWSTTGGAITGVSSADYQIALTSSNEPIVASLSLFNGTQKPTVRKFDGSNWVTLGLAGFSYGQAANLRLLVDQDSIYLAYSDRTLTNVVVAKYDGNNFGALGTPTISWDTASNPMIAKAGNDIFVSYASNGLFVRKLVNSVIVPFYSCDSPTPSVTGITDTSATIHWPSPSMANFGFQYSLDTVNGVTVTHFTAATTYTATSLLPNKTYYFFIRNICGIDTSAWISVSFTTTATNVLEPNSNNGLKAYPNPFLNTVIIEGIQEKQVVQLLDISGRVIEQWIMAGSEKQQLNLQSISSGYYILKIKGNKNISYLPLYKQ